MRIDQCDPSLVTPTTPLRLEAAAKLAFPMGGITAAGLRREAERGRLVVELIAGKYFTTLANIEAMRELCRVKAKGQATPKVARNTMSAEMLPSRRMPAPAGSKFKMSEADYTPGEIAQAALKLKLARRSAGS